MVETYSNRTLGKKSYLISVDMETKYPVKKCHFQKHGFRLVLSDLGHKKWMKTLLGIHRIKVDSVRPIAFTCQLTATTENWDVSRIL